jgi:hypothetical protein
MKRLMPKLGSAPAPASPSPSGHRAGSLSVPAPASARRVSGAATPTPRGSLPSLGTAAEAGAGAFLEELTEHDRGLGLGLGLPPRRPSSGAGRALSPLPASRPCTPPLAPPALPAVCLSREQ